VSVLDPVLTIDVNSSEARVNEKSECSGEIVVTFALARHLNTLLELINRDFTILQRRGPIRLKQENL
jgi:hypothetical protein